MVYENIHLMYMVYKKCPSEVHGYENIHLKYMVYEKGL